MTPCRIARKPRSAASFDHRSGPPWSIGFFAISHQQMARFGAIQTVLSRLSGDEARWGFRSLQLELTWKATSDSHCSDHALSLLNRYRFGYPSRITPSCQFASILFLGARRRVSAWTYERSHLSGSVQAKSQGPTTAYKVGELIGLDSVFPTPGACESKSIRRPPVSDGPVTAAGMISVSCDNQTIASTIGP